MINFIIDTAGEKIFLKIISDSKEYNIKHGLKARERIIKKFSKNRRQAQFKRVLKQNIYG